MLWSNRFCTNNLREDTVKSSGDICDVGADNCFTCLLLPVAIIFKNIKAQNNTKLSCFEPLYSGCLNKMLHIAYNLFIAGYHALNK